MSPRRSGDVTKKLCWWGFLNTNNIVAPCKVACHVPRYTVISELCFNVHLFQFFFFGLNPVVPIFLVPIFVNTHFSKVGTNENKKWVLKKRKNGYYRKYFGYLGTGYPGTQIPRYPDTQIPRYPDTQIPRYPDTQIPRYPDTQIPRYPDTQIPRYPDTQIPRYPDTQIPRYPDTQIPRYPDTQVQVQVQVPRNRKKS